MITTLTGQRGVKVTPLGSPVPTPRKSNGPTLNIMADVKRVVYIENRESARHPNRVTAAKHDSPGESA